MEPSVTFHKLINQLFQVCKDGKVDNSTEVQTVTDLYSEFYCE